MTDDEHVDTRTEKALLVLGIVVLGFNLRPAVVSVGPVLDEITDGLSMTSTTAGLLTTLPVIAFALFGATASGLARWIGIHKLTLLSLGAVMGGLALRALVDSPAAFLALSLVALAGMATANVLLPSLVKLHFPRRVGLLTSLYTTAMAVGLTSASVFTVPLSEQLGSWRWGLFAWAATALVAALPWLALTRHDRKPEIESRSISLSDVARTPLGWAMAVFFGLQALQAFTVFGWFAQVYRDAGFSATTAGLLLGVTTAISIPLSFVVPSVAARLRNQSWLISAFVGCYAVGFVGLTVAPVDGAWLWATAAGLGASVFPLALTLIGLRARTEEGTAALSGFTQSVGYLLAAGGPLGVGVLYDMVGDWSVPLTVLSVLFIPLLVAGLIVARPAYIEDYLGKHPGPA
ncbi:MFS transporter [Microbacterium sp.]|uniref:CynX/NimT family MFS transporter n=1 Tax=Microbacterium sp. TaxID=51671 RepID=UPI0028AE5B48|nr:MFS transporter [Microbacterium sp.]